MWQEASNHAKRGRIPTAGCVGEHVPDAFLHFVGPLQSAIMEPG